MDGESLDRIIDRFVQSIGSGSSVKVRKFFVGKVEPIGSAIIFIDGLSDKNIINRDILEPLMFKVIEDMSDVENLAEFLCNRYIPSNSITIESDFQKAIFAVKSGYIALILEDEENYIIIDAVGGKFRDISSPLNENSISGPLDSFVENIDTNISLLSGRIKDKNMVIDSFVVGERSQTRLSIAYIKDIVDDEVLENIKLKIESIKIDFVTAVGMIEQLIVEKNYTIFPTVFSSERPDRIVANIMEGKVAIILDGSQLVITVPTVFWEFFNTNDDYYNNTLVANVQRLLRLVAISITLFLPALYLVVVQFSSELIPINFIVPIVQSRSGMPLNPFLEILLMQMLIEFLREGGLRLPSKVAQTLSIVGGIIIGDAAVQSKIVSPTTLLVVGVTVVASFLIPNNHMSIHIRFLSIFMLVLANFLGLLSIPIGIAILLIQLCSYENFGVPYMTFYKDDLKDIVVRAPLKQMTTRPEATTNKNKTRR